MDPATRPTDAWGRVADTHGGQDPERPAAKTSLLDAVSDLRRDVAATGFPLPLPDADTARARRTELLDQLDDHLLPRLRELSAPGLVVVAGSTGAGKSTLVNSLLREEVSPAGVLRPTTRQPLLVHHPADGELLAGHPLLADMEAVARDGVPRGIALVDAPDLDSLLDGEPRDGAPAARGGRPVAVLHDGGPLRRRAAVARAGPGGRAWRVHGDGPQPGPGRRRRHGARGPAPTARRARAVHRARCS